METITTIDDCTATQLLTQTGVFLGSGTMELLQHPSSKALTIKLDDLAFALSPQLPIFTHSQQQLAYFIKSPGLENSFVRITLPTGAAISGSELERRRDTFEDALIAAGLLKAGVEAVGDEIGMGLKEDAAKLVTAIQSYVQGYVGGHPSTTSPITFSPTTHNVANGAASGSAAAAGYAATAAQTFSNAVIGVGKKVVDVLNEATKPPPETGAKLHDDLAEAGYSVDDTPSKEDGDPVTFSSYTDGAKPTIAAGKSVLGGIADSTSSISSAGASAAQTVIRHDLGPEAAQLSGKAGETAQNMKSAGKSVFVDASIIGIGKQAMDGN